MEMNPFRFDLRGEKALVFLFVITVHLYIM
jgi:hypothetical protein